MKYPLKSLLEQRRRKVDDAGSELGAAIRAREAAERDRERAEALRNDAEARAAAVREREKAELEDGALRAVDLARADAWAIGTNTEIARLAANEATYVHRVADATGAETRTRAELAQKMAERDVVVKDEARFADRVRGRSLAAEEQAAEEARRRR